MTNEVAATGTAVTNRLCEEFSQQLGAGQDLWSRALEWLTDKGLSFGVDLVAAAVIFCLGWLAIKLIVAMVGKAVEKGDRKKTLLGNFVRNATRRICWAVLIVVVLGKLGVNVAPIIAGLGVTGFILGFAFQESLGNLASGLMIAINEPFRIGDYVIIAGLEGTVAQVDMMATVLTTADNKKIVIPNKSAWGSPITNFTALGRRRVDLKIGIPYESDLVKAIRVARETLAALPGVLPDPKPSVDVASIEGGQVSLALRPWAENAAYWTVYNDALVAVKAAFGQNGISLSVPPLAIRVAK